MTTTSGGSGVFEEGCHMLLQRVYYEHTDAGGIVYHGTYLRFADRARTELIRALGFENSWLQTEHAIALIVRRCEIDFFKPARLDDLLTIRTTLTRLGGATVDWQQVVCRDEDDLARIDIRLGCMGLNGRVARMPKVVREILGDPRLRRNGG